jgi:putative phosphonate metabolism protein
MEMVCDCVSLAAFVQQHPIAHCCNESAPMSARYAVYFAPAQDSLLWQQGCVWLGRDAESDSVLAQPDVEGIARERVQALTASPRRYGLHATLKPPFALAPGVTYDMLIAAVRALASGIQPFTLPRLGVDVLSGFIALQTVNEDEALRRLADACVTELDRYRLAADADELARRRSRGLSAAQDALLARFGYPYVMQEWRFHITLTERVGGTERELLLAWLARHFAAALATPIRCDDICLFVQERRDTHFTLHRRFALGAC